MEEKKPASTDSETTHEYHSDSDVDTKTVIGAIENELEKEKPDYCKLLVYGVMLLVMLSIPLCGTLLPIFLTKK